MTEFIDHIEAIPFRLPMLGALKWGAYSGFSEAEHVLVRVTLKSGAVGVGEAMPRPTIYGETIPSILHILTAELAPRIVGQPLDFDHLAGLMGQIKNNQTAKGALDMALHDAAAQAAGVSLAAHLGCDREAIRVSYILGVGENDALLAEAQRVYDAGVRVLKVKIGRRWDEDLERIHLLQQIAPDLDLYVDANETMTAAEAPTRLEALAEAGILFCEEPLPVEQIQPRAALRQAQKLPLIGDDSCFSLRDLKRELAADTFDILNIKCARTGYTESLKMVELARAHQRGIMVGSQASATLGAARHALFAGRSAIEHPSEVTFFLKMKEDITSSRPPIHNGMMTLADALQVQVDDAQLRQHRL